MQSRYAIHICGSGIPNTNEHLLVKPHDFPLQGNRLNKLVPYRKKKKKANDFRASDLIASCERDIQVYLIRVDNLPI